jgi:hypothetical protein
MSLIINLEIWFAQSLRVSRIWIKEIPIRKNKLWKNLEAPDSYGKSSNVTTGSCGTLQVAAKWAFAASLL